MEFYHCHLVTRGTKVNITIIKTVYAKVLVPVLHLLLDYTLIKKVAELRSLGCDFTELTLHVGPGTFKPIEQKDIRNYEIHGEWIDVYGVYVKLALLELSVSL